MLSPHRDTAALLHAIFIHGCGATCMVVQRVVCDHDGAHVMPRATVITLATVSGFGSAD